MKKGTAASRWITSVALGLALLLSSCSGGGGGGSGTTNASVTPLSGTAASGSPIVGNVLVKDSTGATRSAVIGTAGAYQVDVGGMTPPFLLQAQGLVGNRSVTMYSAATAADMGHTVNITPLTDLMVAMVAHAAPGTYFSGGNFAGITDAALRDAQSLVQTQLQSVATALGLDPSMDLRHSAFAANHSGMDAMLDLLQETPASGNSLTFTNLADGSSFTCNVAMGTFSGTLTAGNVLAYMNTMQQIAGRFNALAGFFAAGLPSPANTSLRSLFDQASFMHDGSNLGAFLDAMTADQNFIGMHFTAINLEQLTSNQARVGYVWQAGGLTRHGEMNLNWSGSQWLLAGNQHHVNVALRAASYRPNSMSGGMMMMSSAPRSGLQLDLSDPGGAGASYAVMTGPGLPTTTGGTSGHGAGLLLFRNPSGTFQIAAPGAAYNGPQTPGIASPIDFYAMSDSFIGNLSDNMPYTVQVYDGAGTLLGSYPMILAKPPHLASGLASTDFPVVTMPSNWMMMCQNGGMASLSWTLPSGYAPDELRVEQWGTAGEMTVAYPGIAGSNMMATMTLPPYSGTLSSSFVWFAGADIYDRQFGWGGQIQ